MIRIGITGQAGFIGTHLYNTLGLNKDKYERIEFKDDYFQKEETLDAFVKQCDVIVHLAAMNRHNDPDVLYKTNIELVQKLISSLERTKSKPYVIMSSSLQEERDNLYGRSKREGRELFNQWADRNGAAFTGLIIPNVFGPFGVPYYNSVISTFSYQIANGLQPKIEVDAELKLIYVGDLVQRMIALVDGYTDGTDVTDGHGLTKPATESTESTEDNSQFSILNSQLKSATENTENTEDNPQFSIINSQLKPATENTENNSQFSILNSQLKTATEITEGTENNFQFSILNSQLKKPEQLIYVEHIAEYKVSELLEKIKSFREQYQVKGVFPDLRDRFELCLFNTFRSYIPMEHFPVKYTTHADRRGVYVEAMKFSSGGQASYSTTVPGITRGNHLHTRKVERFAVIQGKASIKLRKYGTDEVIEYILDGSEPGYVDMPVWYTHNITNIGDTELLTMFWINEFYDPADPDTYYEEV